MNFKYDNIVMEESAQILEVETFIPMLLQVWLCLSLVLWSYKVVLSIAECGWMCSSGANRVGGNKVGGVGLFFHRCAARK